MVDPNGTSKVSAGLQEGKDLIVLQLSAYAGDAAAFL